jgi:hypothetical protein
VIMAGGTMSPINAKSAMTVVTPTVGRPGHYDARLQDGGVTVQASRQPFLVAGKPLRFLPYRPRQSRKRFRGAA